MNGIKDKVCIVTGGGSDIGRACALEFAKAGAAVFLIGRNEEKLKEVIKEIKKNSGNAAYAAVDPGDEEQVKTAVESAAKIFGPPVILINNTADREEKTLHNTSVEDWNRILNNNVRGVFLCCRHVLPHMMNSGGGSIINISSVYAIRGASDHGAYSVAMGGVLSLTRSMAVEYAPYDVRVNAIIPGVIKTGRYKEIRTAMDPGFEKKLLRHIPMGRLGRPEEVASVALFLAGEGSSYVTGAEITVDGGYCVI